MIKFPTRSRPKIFLKTLSEYIFNINDFENTCIVITCDLDDREMNTPVIRGLIHEMIPTALKYRIDYSDSKTKIEAINNNMQSIHHYFDWDICLLASDDMIPQIRGYDEFIREKLTEHFSDTDGALWLNDGKTFDKLNTIVCVGRQYAERSNLNLYHPSYKSLWCDNEETDKGIALGKLIYIEKVIIKNESPDWKGSIPRDQLYIKNNKHYNRDEANYKVRKTAGFPL